MRHDVAAAHHTTRWQNLWLGLQRSLIIFDTLTLVLYRRASSRHALSPLLVLIGSVNSTSVRSIPVTSNYSGSREVVC